MKIGENIQKYRKSLGMSQEELGQKLLVSRQTISLWEKEQTVPTIDNLIRLKEVFGISVDEILGLESKTQATEDQPNEAYQFHFTRAESNEIYRLQRTAVYKRPFLSALLLIFLIIFCIGTSAYDSIIGFAFGAFFIGSVFCIKGIRAYNKTWKNSIERICESTYEYKIFETYIMVNIYRKNEKVRALKCYFTDIEQIYTLGNWLFFQIGGQLFVVRRSDLKENSAFFFFMYTNPTKVLRNVTSDKWRVISIILFVASLLSIWAALVIVGVVSSVNNLFVENTWLFFLLTPIPIASIVYGFVLKAKNYPYKKNVIAGIIMTFFLCVYGSFAFIF